MTIKVFKFVLFFTIVLTGLDVNAAKLPVCDPYAPEDMKASYHQNGDKRILVLFGSIKSDTGQVLEPYIKRTSSYDEVWMCSGGGSVKGGIELGWALNKAKATVRTTNNYSCVSACTIAAMGGYARIIEPDGHFVIHASSRFLSFGYDVVEYAPKKWGRKHKQALYLKCTETSNKAFCKKLRALDLSKFDCPKYEDLYTVNTKCAVFDTKGKSTRQNLIVGNTFFLVVLSQSPDLMSEYVAFNMRNSVSNEIRLLKYYHAMLLDGRTKFINRYAYNRLSSRFSAKNIFEQPSTHIYARNIKTEMQALDQTADDKQFFGIWQLILTDGELSVKEQLIDYIRTMNIDLGPAGKDALKIYDAMRTCQIQSTCELERHTAEALGYHNMYDYN